jgi:hypothetical protein
MANQTILVTKQQITNFRSAAARYISQVKKRNKLHYALERMLARTKKVAEDFYDEEQDILIECASTDERGNLIYASDNRTLAMTKEKRKEFDKKLRELSRREIEVEPYYATEIPDELDAQWYFELAPFVLPQEE